MNMKRLSLATAIALSFAAPLAFAQADPKIDPNQIRAMSMAKKMDTNHDGMVSKEEFMKAMEERWNAMDTNKTGMVSVEQAARNMLFLDNRVGTQ